MRDVIENTVKRFVWWATFALGQERGESIETSYERAQAAEANVRVFR